MGYNWAKYKDINLHICMYNEGKIATQNKKKRSYLNPYPIKLCFTKMQSKVIKTLEFKKMKIMQLQHD